MLECLRGMHRADAAAVAAVRWKGHAKKRRKKRKHSSAADVAQLHQVLANLLSNANMSNMC